MAFMTKDDQPGLRAAYGLSTPDDSRRLYRDWAETYDDDFVAGKGYAYPQRVAELYADRGDADAPVIDIGAGTGAVGRALVEAGCAVVDGLDISPEMLAVAERKGGYRKLFEADLTQPLHLDAGAYGGAVSAGTFTHGHVGPDALEPVVRLVRRGGLLVIGVNAEHFVAEGFQAAFDRLAEAGRVSAAEYIEVGIYGPDADHEHKDDTALLAVMTRRGD
jgi:predicted TPR repeat methyltransferase